MSRDGNMHPNSLNNLRPFTKEGAREGQKNSVLARKANKEAREALRILENNDILAFGRLGDYSNKIDIDVIGKHVGIRYNRELLRNGKTNDGRRLDAKDRQILQELENILVDN